VDPLFCGDRSLALREFLASKRWSDSSGRNRFVAYMNASSVSLPSKVSRSILACSFSLFPKSL
jgi:hypothetical protein